MGRLQLTFVYRRDHLHLGSTVMRAQQLCAIAQRYLGEQVEATCVPLPSHHIPGGQVVWARTRKPGGVWLLTKACLPDWSPQAAAILRARAAGVCYDHVDTPMEKLMLEGADLHLCTSFAQEEALKAQQARVPFDGTPCVLLHNVDVRLEGLPPAQRDHFAALYLGDPVHTVIPKTLAAQITQINARTSAEFAAALGGLSGFNLHYALRTPRPRRETAIKPFVKGFTAAALGANILVGRGGTDVQAFLGDDYPYLVDTTAPEDIAGMFARAQDGFGGAEWLRAQERMKEVHARTEARAIAARLWQICDMLTG